MAKEPQRTHRALLSPWRHARALLCPFRGQETKDLLIHNAARPASSQPQAGFVSLAPFRLSRIFCLWREKSILLGLMESDATSMISPTPGLFAELLHKRRYEGQELLVVTAVFSRHRLCSRRDPGIALPLCSHCSRDQGSRLECAGRALELPVRRAVRDGLVAHAMPLSHRNTHFIVQMPF